MTEREKVIKGLECCVFPVSKGFPYQSHIADKSCEVIECPYRDDCDQLLLDALELLKEYVYGIRCVPVVRCYECQYWEPENAEEGDHSGHCRKVYGMSENAVTDGTWFCSDGERDPDA